MQEPSSVAALRTAGRSPLFLTVCISHTLMVLLGLIHSLADNGDPTLYVTSAVFTLGVWLIYFNCRTDAPTCPTAGITLLRVLYWVIAVTCTIALGLCIIALCISTTAPTQLYDSVWQSLEANLPAGTIEQAYDAFQSFTQGTSFENFVRTVATTALTLCVVVLTIWLFLAVVTVRSLTRIRQQAKGLSPKRPISPLLTVALYLSALGDLLVLAVSCFHSPAPLPLFTTVASLVANFTTAMVLQRYRKQVGVIQPDEQEGCCEKEQISE